MNAPQNTPAITSLKLISLGLRNFMSYGNNVTVVRLDQPGTTFIVGQDLDNTTNGTGSNGVGKTTILNAVVYALYNRALSDDVTVDGLINNINKKNMEITLDFSIGNTFYRIIRARKMKSGPSGNYVKFYRREGNTDFEEGDDASKGHSVYDTDKDIIAVIGMKFDIFTRIVVFSAMKEPFFNLPLRSHGTSKKANQTDFIEELFGLTELSEKAESLKSQSKDVSRRLNEVQMQVQFQEKEYARYIEQVTTAKRRVENWSTQRDQSIVEIETTLTDYNNFDFAGQIDTLETIKRLTSELKTSKTSAKSIEQQIKQLTKTMKASQKELSLLEGDQCPYCMQKFAENAHKVSECQKTISDHDQKLQDIAIEYENILDVIEGIESDIVSEQSKLVYPDLTVHDLQDVERTVLAGQQEIEKHHNAINPFVEPLDDLLSSAIDEVDYTEINELTKQLDHYDFLHKLLTKKDSFVRRNLLNKNLPFLNQQLQVYLSELGLAHKVEFTHELTAKISQFGRELSFGNLSTGQRARVNIALSFAFRDVLQAMHTPVNICMLDEVLDVGLNGGGVQMAVKMLKRKARDEKLSMYVISHRDEIDSAFDRTLTVQMSKGFSYIYYDDEPPKSLTSII